MKWKMILSLLSVGFLLKCLMAAKIKSFIYTKRTFNVIADTPSHEYKKTCHLGTFDISTFMKSGGSQHVGCSSRCLNDPGCFTFCIEEGNATCHLYRYLIMPDFPGTPSTTETCFSSWGLRSKRIPFISASASSVRTQKNKALPEKAYSGYYCDTPNECWFSEPESDPWWVGELNTTQLVSEIQVMTHGYKFGHFKKVYVYLGLNPYPENDLSNFSLIGQLDGDMILGEPWLLQVEPNELARYVVVVSQSPPDGMMICDIQVFAP